MTTAATILRSAIVVLSLAVMIAGPGRATEAPAPSLDLARALVDAEQYEDAVAVLKDLDAAGTVPAARIDLLMGRIYLSISKPAKALDFFEHASMATLDGEAEADLGLAEAKLALGSLAQARRHAETALKTDRDLVGAHLVLARIDQRLGKSEAAVKRLRTLERDRPDAEDVAIVFARYLVEQEGPESGIRHLDGFIRRFPTAPAAQDTLGQLLWAAGRRPDAVAARINAGQLFMERRQIGRASAIAVWLKAVDPDGRLEEQSRQAPPLPPPPAVVAPQQPPEAMPPPPPVEPAPPPPSAPATPPRKGIVAAVLPRPEPLPFAPGSSIMTGSGIVVEGGLQIVTNRHVIDGMNRVAVRNGTGHVRVARVVRISQDDDLALLEIESAFPEAASLPLADIVEASPGRQAVVMGFPAIGIFGDEQPALTEGVIAKTVGLGNDPNTFQMTAKINKGNSGGPVFDRRGRLIGITVAKVDVAGIFERQGILLEDMNIGIKAGRVLRFLNRPANSAPARASDLDLEDLYQEMLPRVVLIAAQK
ncbi:MAG: serine protease [Magnetospirillum sp.]|nr:MAG: serine protease [Magnetospirillum sp.]